MMTSLNSYKISIICFLDLFGASLIVPVFHNYLKSELNFSNFLIGILSSLFSLLQIVSAPCIGYLSDVYGRRVVLLSCIFICSFAYLFLGVYRNMLIIFLVRIILGIFKHVQVISKAYISDIYSTNSNSAYSQLMVVTWLGFFVGPALGGHIITYNDGFMYICILTSVIFSINFVYCFIILDVDKSRVQDKAEYTSQNLSKAWNSIAQHEEQSENTCPNVRQRKNNSHLEKIRKEKPVSTSNSCHSSFTNSIRNIFNVDWSLYLDIFILKFIYAFSMTLFYSNYVSVLKYSFDCSSTVIGYSVSFQGIIGTLANVVFNIKDEKITKTNDNDTKKNTFCKNKQNVNNSVSSDENIMADKLNGNETDSETEPIIDSIDHCLTEKQEEDDSYSNDLAEASKSNSYNLLFYNFILLSVSTFSLYLTESLYIFVLLLIPLSISSSMIRVLTLNIVMSHCSQHESKVKQGKERQMFERQHENNQCSNEDITTKKNETKTRKCNKNKERRELGKAAESFNEMQVDAMEHHNDIGEKKEETKFMKAGGTINDEDYNQINVVEGDCIVEDVNRRGNISGLYNSVTSIAKVISPLLSGIVVDYVSTNNNYKITFLASFILTIVGVVLCKYVIIKNKNNVKCKQN